MNTILVNRARRALGEAIINALDAGISEGEINEIVDNEIITYKEDNDLVPDEDED